MPDGSDETFARGLTLMVPDGPAALLRACERMFRRSSEGRSIRPTAFEGLDSVPVFCVPSFCCRFRLIRLLFSGARPCSTFSSPFLLIATYGESSACGSTALELSRGVMAALVEEDSGMPCNFFVELLPNTLELSAEGMASVEEEVKEMACNVLVNVLSIALERSVRYTAGVVEEEMDLSFNLCIKLLSTTLELSAGGKA